MRFSCVFALAAFAACAPSANPEEERPGFTFEAFTFEMGVLPESGPAFGAARAAALPAELARSAADVLCLNGLHDVALRAAVIEGTAGTFPFHVDLQTDESTPIDDPTDANGDLPREPEAPACVGEDAATLDAVLTCLDATCASGGRLASGQCIYYGACASVHNALERRSTCHDCFHNCAELGGCTLAETRARCTAPSKGVPLAYGGRHGTMLLSRHPLSGPQRWVLPATDRRVVLFASVELPGATPVNAYCLETSWTPDRPNASNLPYRGSYGGGDPVNGAFREHTLQGERIASLVRATSGAKPAVIMGELRASPQVEEDGVVVTYPYNAPGLLPFDHAFVAAVPPGFRPFCTICSNTNPLAIRVQQWTTHVYVSNLARSRVQASHRTMMGSVVRTGDERTPFVPLSPHYGVCARVTP